MAIEVSNSVNFKGNTVKTKKGGEYKSTNVGAYTGLVAGGALGSIVPAHKMNKIFSSEEGKQVINMLKPIVKDLTQRLLPEEPNAFNNIVKSIKRGYKGAILLLGATTALVGLGAGCAIDACINHNRAKKADNGLASNQNAATAKKV